MVKRTFFPIPSSSPDYTFLGISSHVRDYKLSFLINQKLDYQLVKMNGLQVDVPGSGEKSAFSLYFYQDEEQQRSFYLIANRNGNMVLIPSFRQFDFFLVIEGVIHKTSVNDLIKRLKAIPSVLALFEIRTPEIKNYESIITDIELHMMNE